MNLKSLRPLICSVSSLFLVSCAATSTNGVGGAVKTGQSSPAIQAQGIKEFQKMKSSKKISRSGTYNTQVQRVGSRLAKVIPYSRAWEFVVFEDKSPNAFALPGGKVGINTGIFQITQNEAGLAAVMGHEMAHVTGAHAESRVQRQKGLALGGLLLDGILQSQGVGAGARQAAQSGTNVVFGLPHSRVQELEADRVGTLFMAKAGYDPRQAVSFWSRFNAYNKKSGGQSPEFLRTHPLDSTRINALQSYLPTALKAYSAR